MNIVLIGNYPADSQSSMLRYAAFLERRLRLAGHQVRLIQPRVFARKLLPNSSPLGKWLGYIDKFLLFRAGFSRLIAGADVVHICDHSNSIYLSWIKSVPKLITCHDALAIRSALGHYPQNPTGRSGKALQGWILRSLRLADLVVYVSNKTRVDFEQLLGIEVPHDVIPNALNWPYSAASDAEIDSLLPNLGLERNGYILHVGGNQWYKNRLGVLRMFAILRTHELFRGMRLVMVGQPLTEEMQAWCRANGMEDVLELLDVGNEQLRALYSGAFALLFPSLEEGFGWPVLEAQACGCPVITSNRAPLNEIAGPGAKFVDPGRSESIIAAALECFGERTQMIDAGFRNLTRFNDDDVIRSYEACYEAVSSGREKRQAAS